MIKIGNSASNISVYSCQPKTRDELSTLIEKRIKKEGPKCDLNDIDVSLVEDMSYMFYNTKFNGDISKWNVSNVKYMSCMFGLSKFNKDISKWDVSNVENMGCMFDHSKFNQNISDWNVSKVEDMRWLFAWSNFNQDISKWNISEDCQTEGMFNDCPIKEEFKPKSHQKK